MKGGVLVEEIDVEDNEPMAVENGAEKDGPTVVDNVGKDETVAVEIDAKKKKSLHCSRGLNGTSRLSWDKKNIQSNPAPNEDAPKRERRSAFKKCTEWFKEVTGQIEAKHFCFKCNEAFSSKRELKTHVLSHKVKSEYIGMDDSMDQIKTDRLESPDQSSFECDECDERFSSRKGLASHKNKHTESNFTCEQCGRGFSKKGNLLAHLRIHDEEIPQKEPVFRTQVSRVRKHVCKKCDARFAQLLSLKQHQLFHMQEEQYLDCKKCDKRFAKQSSLLEHEQTHEGNADGSDFKRRILKKHLLSPSERRKAECTVCNKQFAERSELKIHYLTAHGTENLCSCVKCNKTFSSESALKRHLVSHDGRKPFKCQLCNETFTQKSALNRHQLLHGGEEFYRFICSVCNRKFSRRGTLIDHLRTHTGEKPFVCAVCKEGFSQKSAMKRHQMLHFKQGRGKKPTVPDVDTGATDDILLSLVYSDSQSDSNK